MTPTNLQAALVHSYTTVFLWSASIFVAGAVVAGVVFRRGNLTALASEGQTADVEIGTEEPSLIHTCRLRVACR